MVDRQMGAVQACGPSFCDGDDVQVVHLKESREVSKRRGSQNNVFVLVQSCSSCSSSLDESLLEEESSQFLGGSYTQQTGKEGSSRSEIEQKMRSQLVGPFSDILLELRLPMPSLSTTSSVHMTAFFFGRSLRCTVVVAGA